MIQKILLVEDQNVLDVEIMALFLGLKATKDIVNFEIVLVASAIWLLNVRELWLHK